MRLKYLRVRTQFTIVPSSPFHFDATFYKPGHFPSGDTYWAPGQRWQTMLWSQERLGLIFAPGVKVTVFSQDKLTPAFLKSLRQELIWRYNLDLNLADFYHDLGTDPKLAPLFRKFAGLRPINYGSLYEYLAVV